MEITPQVLEDVKFTTRGARGYDRAEVDEFLERVGVAVAQVQNRLREAGQRAEAAEARALALGNRSEAEETLKRTLVLAQRTADAAVAEANETAARTISEAEARAARVLADAEAHVATLRTEAEAEARRVIETTRAPLVEEIKELEQLRSFLHDDIQLLEGHLASQRERLRAQIADLQRLIDDPGMLEVEPTPATSGVDPAPALPPETAPEARPVSTAPEARPASTAEASPASTAAPAPNPFAEPPPTSAPEPHTSASVWGDDDVEPASEQRDEWSSRADEDDEPPWGTASAFSVSHDYRQPSVESPSYDPGGFDAGPPTREVQSLADLEAGGDSFLDQLRRAVDDDPDDDRAMTAFFDQDEDERPRSRFGRRR